MRWRRAAMVLALGAAALSARPAGAGDVVDEIKRTIVGCVKAGKACAKVYYASPPGPDRAKLFSSLKDLDLATREAIKKLCGVLHKQAYPDGSHLVDAKAIGVDPGWKVADCPAGARNDDASGPKFAATWTGKSAAGAVATLDVLVTGYPHFKCAPGEPVGFTTKFDALHREASDANATELVQAFLDDWTRTAKAVDKTVQAGPKTTGIATVFASATCSANQYGKPERRDWYAWTTPGVRSADRGVTWVAVVKMNDAASADDAVAAKVEIVFAETTEVAKW